MTQHTDERDAFEAWVLLNRTRFPEETLDLTQGMNNDYPHSRWVQMDWEVWQAARATPQAQINSAQGKLNS